jgi:heat shock protein HslJ
MSRLCRRFARCLLLALALGSLAPAIASEGIFPFDRELLLDSAPMRGSKRLPILEIAENGAASIQLWCTSARGQANVGADSITIVPGAVQTAQCAPERQSRDDSLLAALTQVTNWRRRGDVIELFGSATLRFRLLSN